MIVEQLITNITPQLSYVTFLKYYPVRYEVNDAYKQNRRVVYDFKGGLVNPSVNSLFASRINTLRGVYPNKSFWISAIPASTVDKTQRRYQTFCNTIAGSTQINNGYSLLTAINDRDEVHTGDRDYSHILESIHFSPSIRGKDIILCDDVITTGKSFRIIANQLRILGATSITGIVLARTQWLEG